MKVQILSLLIATVCAQGCLPGPGCDSGTAAAPAMKEPASKTAAAPAMKEPATKTTADTSSAKAAASPNQERFPGLNSYKRQQCEKWVQIEDAMCDGWADRSFMNICTNVCGVSGQTQRNDSDEEYGDEGDMDNCSDYYNNYEATQREHKEALNAASVGFKYDNQTAVGDIGANINYGSAVEYNQAWQHWFETESQDPAAQQLVGHLNSASQSAGWSFVQQQHALSENAFNLVKQLSDFSLGHKDCNAQVYQYCLQNANPPCMPHGPCRHRERPPKRDFGKCAQSSGCLPLGQYNFWEYGSPVARQHNQRKMRFQRKMRLTTRKLKEAEKQLAKSIGNDVQRHLLTQEQNAISIAKNYTSEVRTRLTAYGCDANCVNRCTQNPRDLTRCGLCTCPKVITVTANPGDKNNALHEFFQH